MTTETVMASDGTLLPLAQLQQTIAYSGGNVSSFTVTYISQATGISRNFRQTLTYSGANVSAISNWVAL